MIEEERAAMAKLPRIYSLETERRIKAKLTLALTDPINARTMTDQGNAARQRRGKI
jgi:hypothetical protein